MLKPGCY